MALGRVLYTGAFWLVLSDALGERRTLVVLVVAAGVIFTVTGAIAAMPPPGQPHGRADARRRSPLVARVAPGRERLDSLFTIGYVLSGLAFVPFTLLILSYPTGRLRPTDRWFVLASAAIVVARAARVAARRPDADPDLRRLPARACC